MSNRFLKSRLGFHFFKNRDYWISRILPAGFGTPAYALFTFIPFTIGTAVNNGEAFPTDRILLGLGAWFLVGILMSAMLYGVFRILDNKDYAKMVAEDNKYEIQHLS